MQDMCALQRPVRVRGRLQTDRAFAISAGNMDNFESKMGVTKSLNHGMHVVQTRLKWYICTKKLLLANVPSIKVC